MSKSDKAATFLHMALPLGTILEPVKAAPPGADLGGADPVIVKATGIKHGQISSGMKK
jgi:hypothetical protein